jgi:hypothetical protein
MTVSNEAVLLPWLGEFGWMIMRHVRWAHAYQADSKIVCCQPGHECLFPSGTAFFTDWTNPIAENRRCEHTAYQDRGATDRFYAELTPRLKALFPRHEIATPHYICHWHMADHPSYKFRPTAPRALPKVDVTLGVRRRAFGAERNWPYWSDLAALLRAVGLTVGILGDPATSHDCAADGRAWDHPQGPTAGTVDLLSGCRLYVGGDSGISHLAALLDVPTLLIDGPNSAQIGPMARANHRFFSKLPASAWQSLDAVYGAALRCLQVLDGRAATADLAVHVLTYGDGRFLPATLDSLFARIAEEPRLKATVHLIANQVTDKTRAIIQCYRSRLAGVCAFETNLGIAGAYEAAIPRIPTAKYMTAEDDVEFLRPLSLYGALLGSTPQVGAASGQHSPDHETHGDMLHAGVRWLLKSGERGQCLVFRATDLETLRPFQDNGREYFDCWVWRDAPLALRGRHRHIAVLPGGVRHMAPAKADTTLPDGCRKGDMREYTAEQIAEAART